MLEKGLSFINENQANAVNTCLLCEIQKKNINWEHVEFDVRWRKVPDFTLLVVYHIVSETETWPFLRLLRMNSLEMQYRSTQNERIKLICLWCEFYGWACCYMLVVRNLKKNINWEHVEFDVRWRKVPDFTLLVVYHIVSETETWPFLRLLLRMNSLEMQYRSTQNERVKLICLWCEFYGWVPSSQNYIYSGIFYFCQFIKGSRTGHSDKVSLYASLLTNTRFRFLYFRISNC